MPMNTWVELDVGGQRFTTTLSTLQRRNSYFSAFGSTVPSSSLIRIDRDPTHFRYILNHLRGCTCIPDNVLHLRELREEADFYALAELVARIEKRIAAHQRLYPMHS